MGKSFLGVPLVAVVATVIAGVPACDRAVVSTDDEEIAAVAEAAGLPAPFRRPPDLSGDRIGDLEVLQHALATMEALDATTYDIVLMLQPTSPLRTVADVQATLDALVAGDWDAAWTVSEADRKYHPYKQLTIADQRLDLYDERGRGVIARQQLRPLYYRNGASYAFARRALVEQRTILPARTTAVVTRPMVSIDDAHDLRLAEWLAMNPMP